MKFTVRLAKKNLKQILSFIQQSISLPAFAEVILRAQIMENKTQNKSSVPNYDFMSFQFFGRAPLPAGITLTGRARGCPSRGGITLAGPEGKPVSCTDGTDRQVTCGKGSSS